MTFLDTHLVVWLYGGRKEKIPPAVTKHLQSDDLYISPMVVLELQLLRESGKIDYVPEQVVETLRRAVGLQICDCPFEEIAFYSVGQSWTRDPFDRIITAQAAAQGGILLTKDRLIQQHYDKAFWK